MLFSCYQHARPDQDLPNEAPKALSQNQAWGNAPGIQIAMPTSAEGAIQLALIQLVFRK